MPIIASAPPQALAGWQCHGHFMDVETQAPSFAETCSWLHGLRGPFKLQHSKSPEGLGT